jgi:hypothetical protein
MTSPWSNSANTEIRKLPLRLPAHHRRHHHRHLNCTASISPSRLISSPAFKMLSRSPAAFRSLRNPAQSAFKVPPLGRPQLLTPKRLNSTAAAPRKGPGFAIPLAIAGVAGAAWYFYQYGTERPVSAAPKATLTNPQEWVDFKVSNRHSELRLYLFFSEGSC